MREGSNAVVVVRPRGRLSAEMAPRLRLELLKAAADEPRMVVCDLTRGVADAVALEVLHPVAQTLKVWPACPLVVVSPDDGDVRTTLGQVTGLVVVRDLAQAPEPAATPPEDRAGLRLRPTLHAPGVARRFVTAVLQGWGLLDEVAVAALVLGELVTNVVLHAATDAEISLTRRRDGLAVAVGDTSPLPIRRRRPVEPDEGGHGLMLVEALSDRWGVLPRHPQGKVAWAILRR